MGPSSCKKVVKKKWNKLEGALQERELGVEEARKPQETEKEKMRGKIVNATSERNKN